MKTGTFCQNQEITPTFTSRAQLKIISLKQCAASTVSLLAKLLLAFNLPFSFTKVVQLKLVFLSKQIYSMIH